MQKIGSDIEFELETVSYMIATLHVKEADWIGICLLLLKTLLNGECDIVLILDRLVILECA